MKFEKKRQVEKKGKCLEVTQIYTNSKLFQNNLVPLWNGIKKRCLGLGQKTGSITFRALWNQGLSFGTNVRFNLSTTLFGWKMHRSCLTDRAASSEIRSAEVQKWSPPERQPWKSIVWGWRIPRAQTEGLWVPIRRMTGPKLGISGPLVVKRLDTPFKKLRTLGCCERGIVPSPGRIVAKATTCLQSVFVDKW